VSAPDGKGHHRQRTQRMTSVSDILCIQGMEDRSLRPQDAEAEGASTVAEVRANKTKVGVGPAEVSA
jgi:hypothetical protein